jgi:hypothetical protein
VIVTGTAPPKLPQMLPLRVALARVRALEASPDWVADGASAKSTLLRETMPVVSDAEPPFAVSDPPVGAVESFVSVRVCVDVLPAASALVTVSVGELDVPSDQAKVAETYGPPDGVETVPGACVQPVDVPVSAAVALDAGSETPSATVFVNVRLPPEPPPVPR